MRTYKVIAIMNNSGKWVDLYTTDRYWKALDFRNNMRQMPWVTLCEVI